jgi:pyroglutamyl-peptidase
MAGTPDAYFSRLPFAAILRALKQGNIPASLSLSAGAYVCNTVMYVTLHALRRRPDAPAGFIHLPYEAAQAVSHRAAPSMSLDLMTAGVEIALKVIAQKLPDAIGKATVPRRSSSRVSGAKAI